MAKGKWVVRLDGRVHEVEVRGGLLETTVEVFLDGVSVHAPGVEGQVLAAADFPLPVAGHRVVVHLRPGLSGKELRLTVDGEDVDGGGEVGDVGASRAKGRLVASVAFFAVGAGIAYFLGERWEISGIPARWFGGGIAVIGVLGLLGVNVFRGGPLDKRLG